MPSIKMKNAINLTSENLTTPISNYISYDSESLIASEFFEVSSITTQSGETFYLELNGSKYIIMLSRLVEMYARRLWMDSNRGKFTTVTSKDKFEKEYKEVIDLIAELEKTPVIACNMVLGELNDEYLYVVDPAASLFDVAQMDPSGIQKVIGVVNVDSAISTQANAEILKYAPCAGCRIGISSGLSTITDGGDIAKHLVANRMGLVSFAQELAKLMMPSSVLVDEFEDITNVAKSRLYQLSYSLGMNKEEKEQLRKWLVVTNLSDLYYLVTNSHLGSDITISGGRKMDIISASGKFLASSNDIDTIDLLAFILSDLYSVEYEGTSAVVIKLKSDVQSVLKLGWNHTVSVLKNLSSHELEKLRAIISTLIIITRVDCRISGNDLEYDRSSLVNLFKGKVYG